MNQLLFERATGALSPNTFAKLETTRLLQSFRPAPQFRLDGGDKGAVVDNGEGSSDLTDPNPDRKKNIWAHQAGVNALALERFDGKMFVQLLRIVSLIDPRPV
jgi:DNA excision repair protein ERCC-8